MKKNSIQKIAVIGAGTMGHSLALIFAQNGYQVQLWSLLQEELDRAENLIKSASKLSTEAGQVPETELAGILSRISYSTDLETVAGDVDFLMETVSEDVEIKRELFSKLSNICPDHIIFASNTSGLNIFEIADVVHPERLIITHWFSPPNLIPLVEVVPGPTTSDEVISSTVSLLEGMGKKTVKLKKFIPAFIVNRIQNAIVETVFEMIDHDWATPEDIDIAIKYTLGIRLPVVGVAQSLDFAGLDLIHSVMQYVGVNSEFLEKKVSTGDLGVKSLKGIYDYQGRQEKEILKKRDDRYLKMMNFLNELGVYEPI